MVLLFLRLVKFDNDQVLEELKFTLMARFGSDPPTVDVFDIWVNNTSGLYTPATVGLLDHRSYSITNWIFRKRDLKKYMIDNLHFCISRWTPLLGKDA